MRRPVGRSVVAVGLIVLGLVALDRLTLTYAPKTAYPAVTVLLTFPDSTDLSDLARRWLVPVESEIRSMGGVKGMRGQVRSNSAWLSVLFEPGSDPERKAARLTSGLNWLRRKLPPGAAISVWPSLGTNDDLVAVVWLVEARRYWQWQGLAEELRGIPGTREVRVYGASSEETVVRLGNAAYGDPRLVERVTRAVQDRMRVVRTGSALQSGKRLPVISGQPKTDSPHRMPVGVGGGVVPLERLAEVAVHSSEPSRLARINGRSGVALLVFRENDASILRVDRAVRHAVERLSKEPRYRGRLTLDSSPVDPLRDLVRHHVGGWFAAVLVLVLAGGWVAGLRGAARMLVAIPLALAAALNALWIAGLGLDLLSLTAVTLSVAVVVPLAALRVLAPALPMGTLVPAVVMGSALLPIAAYVSGGALTPALARPAVAFFLAVLAAAPTVFVITPVRRRRSRSRFVGRALRRFLHDPPTVLLFTATLLFTLFTLFGARLELTSGSLMPDQSALTLRIALSQGTTLRQTEEFVSQIEKQLNGLPEIESHWSLIDEGGATIRLDLARETRSPQELERFKTRLRYRLPGGGVAIRPAYREGIPGSGGALAFIDEIEDRAETDEDAWTYRVVLRSTDLDVLRAAYDSVEAKLVARDVSRSDIRAEWGAPSRRIQLGPRNGTTPDELAIVAARLRESSVQAQPIRLPGPGERTLRVLSPWSPTTPDDMPQQAAVLNSPLPDAGGAVVAGARVRAVERAVFSSVNRQSGRFVLPVNVTINKRNDDLRRKIRANIDRSLSVLNLPAGSDLERPVLSGETWSASRIRVLALVAVLPLLLFAFSAFYLNSVPAGLGALLPGLCGLAAATPLLGGAVTRLDELTVLSLAAMLCGGLLLPLTLGSAILRRARRTDPHRAVYRTIRESLPALAAGILSVAFLLGGAAYAGDPTRHVWTGPLWVTAVLGVVSAVGSIVVLPPIVFVALRWARRDPASDARRRRPPAWRATGAPPRLAVQNLTKDYPGGVRALREVQFDVGPGIVGLLGPNGAGKTTLLRLLTGLLEPTRGSVTYRGETVLPENLPQFRRRLAYLPQNFGTHATLTASQLLEHWAIERGMLDRRQRNRRITELLEIVGLTEEANRKVVDYSGGMQRRIGIAVALLPDPELLIVDEPTTGLDIESRVRFRETLLRVSGEKIVLFSTHIASDVEAVATRLLLIHRGRLRFDGSTAELLRLARGRVFEKVLDDSELREFSGRYRISTRVRTLEGIRVRAIVRPGEMLPGPEVEPNLEEAYLAETDMADPRAASARRSGHFSFLDQAPDGS